MENLTKYEQTLLAGWEDVHKMGQLSLWLMLALKDGPKHMAEISGFIGETTSNVLSVDDKSIYRALRRFKESGLIDFSTIPSPGGPALKVYRLTATGEKVLESFLDRNIRLFYHQKVRNLTQ